MRTRFVRMTVAFMMLIGALVMGSVSHAGACDSSNEASAASDGSTPQGHASHHHPAESDDEDLGSPGLDADLACHSVAAGCAGCLMPSWVNGPQFAKVRLSFPLSDDIERSAAGLNNFRPPITLL
jgi:hypothetical protein